MIVDISSFFVKNIPLLKMVVVEIDNFIVHHVFQDPKHLYFHKSHEFIEIQDKTFYQIEIDHVMKTVFFAKIIPVIPHEAISFLLNHRKYMNRSLECVSMIYARCEKSAAILDPLIRHSILHIQYKEHPIIAVKAIAGSGKTTLLLNIAQKYHEERILYLAFNKSIVEEMKEKCELRYIHNVSIKTFDALLYRMAKEKFKSFQKMSNLQQEIPSFSFAKKWNSTYLQMKIHELNSFCRNKEEEPPTSSDLSLLWEECKKGKIITFDILRKLALIEKWCLSTIDPNYDFILIDESQDFDPMMLEILLQQTTIPKIFVGDPLQAIYQFRGATNAFEKLPKETLFFELYISNRVGYPATKYINIKCDCLMIPRENHQTDILLEQVPYESSYVYLFRNWKNILLESQRMSSIFIFDYEEKMKKIKELHHRLRYSSDMSQTIDSDNDLPYFLKTLTPDDIQSIYQKIMRNIVPFEKAKIKIYTIHSYKGCEDDIVRIYNDIDDKKEPQLFYVALTRGKKKIYLDKRKNVNSFSFKGSTLPDKKISDFFTLNLE